MYEEHEFEMVTAVTPPRRNAETSHDALYILDAHTAPQFWLGQIVQRGKHLGCFGALPVTSIRDGVITNIEYDGWRNEILVGVRSNDTVTAERRPGNAGATHSLVS